MSFWDAVKESKETLTERDVKFENITKDSVYTICYTSGTTGKPKGTMLTHLNISANIGAFAKFDS